jgi:hypothetical protein
MTTSHAGSRAWKRFCMMVRFSRRQVAGPREDQSDGIRDGIFKLPSLKTEPGCGLQGEVGLLARYVERMLGMSNTGQAK